MWSYVLMAFGLLVIGGSKAAGLAAPFALKRAVNHLAAGSTSGLGWVLAYGALKAFGQVLNNSKNVILSRISRPMGRRLSVRLYQHLLGLELQFHTMRKTGALLRGLDRSSRAVDTLLRAVLFTFLPVLLELGVVAGLLYQVGGDVVAIVVCSFVLYFAFTTAVSLGWVTKARRSMNFFDDQQSAKATEVLLNIEQVKLLGAVKREEGAFDEAQRGLQGSTQSLDTAASFLSGGQMAITTTGLVLALWCVARKVCAGSASVGDIFMVQSLVTQLWNPLQFLGYYVREARQSFVDLEDARKLLAREPRFVEAPEKPAEVPHDLALGGAPVAELCNVSFRYASDAPHILEDVSFAVPANSLVALVGSSGGGKSTLGRLLSRLADPTAGTVRFKGVDVRTLNSEELRRRIAVVSQDVVVFNETARYNLIYARPEATEEELQQAMHDADFASVVSTLPDGLDTVVGERGLRLSGGERQRLALARALLRRPELLILDEATSALDASKEGSVLDALYAARGEGEGRAVLAITHRLDTVQRADRILVLENGRIVEQGTHQELLSLGGRYAALRALNQGKAQGSSSAGPEEMLAELVEG